jgi:Zn-dependent protease/predicted transcriptional regulator
VFGRGITLFQIFGFRVKLDLSWILIAILITWSLAKGLFPYLYEELSQATYWWMGIAGAIGLFLSVIFHELSHSIVARRYGLPMRGITLFLFGGVAEAYEEPRDPKTEFLMAVAGPVSSLFLALFFYIIYIAGVILDFPLAVTGVIVYLATINVLLAIFNLLPGFPLDGGRILRSALWHWKGNLRRATRIASTIGAGIGLIFILLGILSFFLGNFIGGMWWVLIGLFLRNAAASSYQQMLIRQAFEGETVMRYMNTEPITIDPSISIMQLVTDFIYKYHFKMFPVVKEGKLVGCVTTRDVQQVPENEWPVHQVGEIATPCTGENTIAPGVDIIKALNTMNSTKTSRLMVVDRGRLLGILTLRDLLDLLAIKMELEGDG